jgi:hypothetical protein
MTANPSSYSIQAYHHVKCKWGGLWITAMVFLRGKPPSTQLENAMFNVDQTALAAARRTVPTGEFHA